MANLEPYGFPGTLEQLWLERQGEDTFKVSCIPFRVYGLALGDRVRLDPADQQVTELLEKSEHRVIRILLLPTLSDDEATQLHGAIDRAITQSHLKSEWSGDRHIAIDLPPDRDLDTVWALIRDAAKDRMIAWEWGDVEQFQPGDVK
ncbi:DUF4265 domain-containing protein [Nocardia uniformis]|uniref:DUF4265 domain-containing protein n=1 Tax=Nocardia uniformis TaxID=53432 RepID=A0A849C8W6_9NOCA|nr:DUF4265 domain-containing protein [Nocardia uniformis]NNH75253.1 DUF4265 domain-containing protein [Nocardia uniformis]